METFFENLTKNAVNTASANNEGNVYALALGAYALLTDAQKRAFDIAYKAYQRKWYLSVTYVTKKTVSATVKKSGVPFVRKYSKVVTHFDNYQSLVAKVNCNFVAENRTWGERVNDVCVYHKGQLYLSMKPTYTTKAKYFIGETEITYEQSQEMLPPSSRDDYKSQKTAERQGVDRENIVRCVDIRIENVGSIKCGKTNEINEIELELI